MFISIQSLKTVEKFKKSLNLCKLACMNLVYMLQVRGFYCENMEHE